ncbi:stationary phase inducible protein CsiE [Escherichia coli]|nr:stationary phase inducible protein CsiE [Escherichia coli]
MVRFYDEQGLCDQLYTHLAQALNRSLFAIGIDNTLPEGVRQTVPTPGAHHPRGRWPDLKVNTASIFLMRKVVWSR